jgi:hypothetical protein
VYCITFKTIANSLSLRTLLGLSLMVYILLALSGHNLCHLLYIFLLFLVVLPHFADHAVCSAVTASISAYAAL